MSSAVVVDTDIISYLLKRDSRADWYKTHMKGTRLMVCFVTIGELYFGAFRAKWGAQRLAELQQILRNYVVCPFDEPLCMKWAEIRARGEQQGKRIHHSDAWIAATAQLYNVPLITNNRKDFACLDGLDVISAPPQNQDSQLTFSDNHP
ncbi:MAG: type II toxin-antitoxin system VapC family toxin [bacterium]|nr:type II toxin-antitoxin system VapC family toxin [bacterium]